MKAQEQAEVMHSLAFILETSPFAKDIDWMNDSNPTSLSLRINYPYGYYGLLTIEFVGRSSTILYTITVFKTISFDDKTQLVKEVSNQYNYKSNKSIEHLGEKIFGIVHEAKFYI